MARLDDEQAQLFLDKNFGWATTIREDGTPQATVVWLDYDGENVLFNTARGRAKPRHVERDPRVTVSVLDPENPYNYVSVSGAAELVDDGAVEHIDKLSHKYNNRDYPLPEGEQRVIVRVKPERVSPR